MPSAVGADAYQALVQRFEQNAPMARVARPEDLLGGQRMSFPPAPPVSAAEEAVSAA